MSILPLLRQLLRFSIGLVMLASAAGKLMDVSGFANVLETYHAFPDAVLLPLALAIPLAELGLALWLFSGYGLAAAAIVSVAMNFAYAVWSGASVLRGLRLSRCGCFGVFWPGPLGWSTVVLNLAVVAASLALWALSPSRTRGQEALPL